MSLVSILIPCYNSEKWIAETIESALVQTWQNKEIIIVDDGSKDNSLAIAKRFESPIVKVISQENRGAGAARNRALKEAQGDFIQYLDADDLLSPDKIESQISILLNEVNKVAVCDTIHFLDGEGYQIKTTAEKWYLYDTDDPIDFLIRLYGGYGQAAMIQPNAYLSPRSVIEKAGLWEEFYSPDDDGEYFCRVILASSGIRLSKKAINYYRKYQNGQSLSKRNSRRAMEGILRSIDLKTQHILDKTDSEKAKYAFAKMYMEHGVNCYPLYKDLSLISIQKAKLLGINKVHYVGGSKGILLSSIIGWKGAKLVSFLLQKANQLKKQTIVKGNFI
jgi:glycosyltransferase involved in cell wall biosynthesis